MIPADTPTARHQVPQPGESGLADAQAELHQAHIRSVGSMV